MNDKSDVGAVFGIIVGIVIVFIIVFIGIVIVFIIVFIVYVIVLIALFAAGTGFLLGSGHAVVNYFIAFKNNVKWE